MRFVFVGVGVLKAVQPFKQFKGSADGRGFQEFTVVAERHRNDKVVEDLFDCTTYSEFVMRGLATMSAGDLVTVTGDMECQPYAKKDGTSASFIRCVARSVELTAHSFAAGRAMPAHSPHPSAGRPQPRPSVVPPPVDDIPF